MRKIITATKENRQFLAKAFGCTERMVYKALSGESDSDRARKIRHTALQRGAQETTVYNDFECWHDADGYMRQYFPNGAMLEVDKKAAIGSVFYKGRAVRRIFGINFQILDEVQRELMAMN